MDGHREIISGLYVYLEQFSLAFRYSNTMHIWESRYIEILVISCENIPVPEANGKRDLFAFVTGGVDASDSSTPAGVSFFGMSPEMGLLWI